MNRQKELMVRPLLLMGILVAAATVGIAQTPPDTLMQINGNAASDPNYPIQCVYLNVGSASCDYWNMLNGAGTNAAGGGIGTGSSAGHSLIRTFVSGQSSTDSFQGGGSKDPNLLSQWKWSSSPTPNKDTLNAGYGALYPGLTNDYILMFGADRVSPNGDANIGIWFFQQNITLNPNGTFNGSHMNGDIFVISAFTGGGGNSNISVLKWDSGCTSGVKNPGPGQCADSNLRLIVAQPSSASCASALQCAVTNSAPTNSTWEGTLASPLFFQGGVNLTSALGPSLPCFSSFLEETRSSQSTSAVLKDFLLGHFPVCSMSINKACGTGTLAPVLVNNGTQVQYTWTGQVQNTGVGALSNVEVDDTLPDGSVVHPSLYIGASQVTSLNPGDSATYTVSATLASLTAVNNATAKAVFGGSEVDATSPAQATCTMSVNSSIAITKSCGGTGPIVDCSSGTACVIKVPIKATVCNKGLVQLTGIGLADSPAAALTPGSVSVLEPAGSPNGTDCASVTGIYQPTAYDANSDGATNGRYTFSDLISVTSATPALGPPIPPVGGTLCPAGSLACAPATCPLCPNGQCSTLNVP